MKISDPNTHAAATSAQQTGRATGATTSGGRGTQATSAAKSDQVQLSNLGSSLKSLASDSAERQSKVSQLAATYQTGNYRVNAHAVGKSVVSEALAK